MARTSRSTTGPRRAAGALALGTLLGLAACSAGTTTTTAASTSTAPTTTAAAGGGSTTAPTSGGASSTGAPASSTTTSSLRKVDANTASVAELQAAFEANGVTNAAKWAREVEEYRPYDTGDPSFASLRKNLAKYNPAPEVLQKILASLSL